jgi:acetolactate synthase-1/2/3 large subunit
MGFGPSSVPAAQNAFKECDVMLAVGTRFAEICTGSYGAVPPEKLIHIDINPGAIGANHTTPIGIHADSRDAVPALAEALIGGTETRDGSAVEQALAKDKAAYRDAWTIRRDA